MDLAILNTSGLIAIFAYLASLLIIGWAANRSAQESSLKDYYLAGSSVGTLSMFFTLYATQYSGNTLTAVPGNAYRTGLSGLSVVVAIIGVVLIYFTFAPKLNRVAREQSFVSIGDFIKWRFDNKALLVAVNSIAVITLMTYALGNFKAVGLLLENASGGQISFAAGILILAGVMAVYESLGGVRGVIWTDILQGSLLFAGCLFLFFAAASLNGPDSITNPAVLANQLGTYLAEDVDPLKILSLIILIAVGAAVYPQAIQRIFIARDPATLKRSYIPLLFMPFLTTLPMILVGISVAEWLPDLDRGQSENVIIYAVGHIMQAYPALSWLLVLYLGASIAAIMSTIDSALLTLGSTVTKDMIAVSGRELSERQLHRISRTVSWSLMMVMAVLAIILPQTIWSLMIFKFEFLIQIAPAFILGINSNRLNGRGVLIGLLLGCLTALMLKLSPVAGWPLSEPLGVHAGIWGLLVNLTVIFAAAFRERGRT